MLVETLIDALSEMLELKNNELAHTPSIGTKYNSGLIKGMWRTDDKFIMIPDINKAFSKVEILDFKELQSQAEYNHNMWA